MAYSRRNSPHPRSAAGYLVPGDKSKPAIGKLGVWSEIPDLGIPQWLVRYQSLARLGMHPHTYHNIKTAFGVSVTPLDFYFHDFSFGGGLPLPCLIVYQIPQSSPPQLLLDLVTGKRSRTVAPRGSPPNLIGMWLVCVARRQSPR
jgi:hypothetical protein